MKLYEFAPTRSIRVRWVLQEMDIPFEAVSVNLVAGGSRNPEFLKLNPAGKIPVLVDGDFVLSESVAIAEYLAEKFPGKGLLPRGLHERARLHQWLMFTVTELEQPLWRIARHTNIYPVERRLAGDVALAREEFAAMVQVAEAHMDGRTFVVGEQVTIADFVLAYTLDMAGGLLDGFPGLKTYMERMYARPKAPMRIKEAFASLRASA